MDLQTFVPQLGFAGIFVYGIIKLYKDKRADDKRRDDDIKAINDERLAESKEREERLMKHLDKQADINREVSNTLKNIHNRLCDIEERGDNDGN